MKKLYSIIFSILLFAIACGSHSQRKDEKNAVTGLNVGNRAPELAYPNPQGKTIALSSLRGEMVLVDFWASWCPPCRRENPYVVKAYQEFKDKVFKNGKGFTVYSISCDKNRDAWTNAIKADHLVWKNQVSDLKGWESQATYIYKISSIPSNVLLDGNGIIIAWNLQGDQLSTKLQSLLK